MADGHVGFASDTPEVWDLYPSVGGDLAFDIGANGGMTARIFAGNFQRVVACEPCSESYERLATNLSDNLTALQIAVSDGPDEVTLRTTSLTPTWGELFSHSETLPWGQHTGTRTVPATTLDKLCAEYGTPDFVKIDTEGHECQILAGGDELFTRMAPTAYDVGLRFIIEVHDVMQGARIRQFLDTRGHSYRAVRHDGYRHDGPYWNAHYWIVNV